MSDLNKDLPRDMRALCGGFELDSDGTYRVLLDPVNAFANIVAVRLELEQRIEDPETPAEDLASLRRELNFVRQEASDLKQRILNHFIVRLHKPGTEPDHPFPKVDQGVKNRVLKLIEEIEAGTYRPRRESKTFQAVRQALVLAHKNGRMPYPSDLKKLGYNCQQVADAGKWLEDHESLFSKLRDGRGRPKKK